MGHGKINNYMANTQIVQSVLNKVRKDKFTMVFTLPDFLKSSISRETRSNKLVDIDSMQFSLYNCPVPAISVPALDVPYGAQVHHVTSHARPKYNPITINFAVDNEYKNYWVIWKWLQALNDPLDSLYVGHKIDSTPDSRGKYNYVTDFHVYGRDEYNNPKIRFDYYDCFVTGLGEIGFNNRDPEELDCNFQFVFNQFTATLLSPGDSIEHIPPEASRRKSIY